MEAYFYWCGMAINMIAVSFIALFIWVWFVWPFFQAISLTKVTVKALGNDRESSLLKLFFLAYKDLCFGKDFKTIRCNLFEWSDVGDWVIYPEGRKEK